MSGSSAKNVAINTNADSDGYLKQGTSTVVALASEDAANPVKVLIAEAFSKSTAQPFINLSSQSFQILPDTSGSYLLSSVTTNTDKVMPINIGKLPNYETALITTRHDFQTPSDSKALLDSFFNGTEPFVNQGEWAPIGIVSNSDGVRMGDLRAPLFLSRPSSISSLAPGRFNNSSTSINVGTSLYEKTYRVAA